MSDLLEVLAAMRVAEPCAGVGGMAMGFEAQGFEASWFAEIDRFALRVLKRRFPGVPVYHDLASMVGKGRELVRRHGVPLVYAGGTPCQDLSVAGHRRGLKGERSGLFYAFMDLWAELGSPLCLWENVPGALSSHSGKDFARVLGAFVGRRFAVPRERRRGGRLRWPRAGVITGPAGVAAWRVLDAQYFGVPQRRRRLFVLGSRARELDPRSILLDPEGVRGDPAAGEAAREGLAARLGDGPETARLRLDRPARATRGDGGRDHGRGGAGAPTGEEAGRADDGPVRVVAFDYKQSAADCGTESRTDLRATEHRHGNANGGGHVGLVAFRKSQRAHTATDGETWVEAPVANTLNAHDLTGSDVRTDTVIADPVSASEGRTYTHEGKTGLRTHNVVMSDPNRRVAGTVEATAERSRGAGTPVPMLAVDQRDDGARDSGAVSSKWAKGTGGPSGDEAYNLTVAPTANGTQRQQVDGAMAVSAVGVPRRLMPLECERLQGWPEILELRGGSYDDIRRAVQGAYEEASPEIRQSPSLRPLWRYREADGETPPGHHEPAGSGRGTLPEVPRNGTSDEPPKAHSRSDLCRLRIYVQTQEAKSLQALLGPQLSSRDGVTFGTTKARCHATLTGWTDVPKRARKRAAGDAVMLLPPSDSKRYRAIGNGVAAPVARWVAWRIRLAAAELYLRLTRV